MPDEVLISILTPAYNSQDSLRQTLGTLKDQDLAKAEFICIDDGSADNTLSIMREFAAEDSRFRVITKANSGYGASMNVGLRECRGHYVGILESDDLLEQGALARLWQVAEQNAFPDIVKANHYCFDQQGNHRFMQNYAPDLCGRLLQRTCADWPRLITTTPAIWAAIYRRDFLTDKGIDFLETPGAAFQDTAFVCKAWAAAESAYVVEEGYVHYCTGAVGQSTTGGGKPMAVLGEFKAIDDYAAQHATPKAIRSGLAVKKLQTYWWNLNRIAQSDRAAFIAAATSDLRGDAEQGLFDENLMSKAEQKHLKRMLDDPDGLLLDLEIAETPDGFKKNALKAKRKLRRLGR